MSNVKQKDPANVTLGVIRFSYAHVWEPAAAPNSTELKYSCCLLIPKSDKALVKLVQDAIAAATEKGKEKWGGKIPGNLKTPLRDGDAEKGDKEEYQGMYFINANNTKKPIVLNRDKMPITEKDDFYSGCFGYANVTFYPFNQPMQKGVACSLNMVLKSKDGEAFSGGPSVEEAFGGVEIAEEASILD